MEGLGNSLLYLSKVGIKAVYPLPSSHLLCEIILNILLLLLYIVSTKSFYTIISFLLIILDR